MATHSTHSIQRSGDLPASLARLVESQDWAGLIRALDGGAPANLVSLGDVPLLEHVLVTLEMKNRHPGSVSVAAAPLDLLEAFVRNGLDREGLYEGRATTVSLVLNYGQWAWGEHLLDLGFPAESPGASVFLSLIDGRLQRAVAASPTLGVENGDPLPPDPLLNDELEPNVVQLGGSPAQKEEAVWGLQDETPDEQAHIHTLLRRLVKAGADLERTDTIAPQPHPLTPLFLAISHLDVTLIEGLIKAGANTTAMPPGWNLRPMDFAVQRGSVAVVHTLVASGVPLEGNPALPQEFRDYAHPLVLAAHLGRSTLVDPLIAGLSPSDLAYYGTMAMHKAAASNQVGSMKALRLHNIPYNAQSTAGTVPLHQAAKLGAEDAIAFLLRRGQPWDRPVNQRGASPGDVLREFHPELAGRFGLSLPDNVKPLFGRRPRP